VAQEIFQVRGITSSAHSCVRARDEAGRPSPSTSRIADGEQGRAVRRRDLEVPLRQRTAAARRHVSAAVV